MIEITDLKARPESISHSKSAITYKEFEKLLNDLKTRKPPQQIVNQINKSIEQINLSTLSGMQFEKMVKKEQMILLKSLEKEMKLVPKNYYRNMWMLLGFTVFGLPIGTALGLSLGNIGLLSIGLPIGMGIGAAIGTSMDSKAQKEGRQLNV